MQNLERLRNFTNEINKIGVNVKKAYKEKLKKEGKITKQEELKILRKKIKTLRAKGLLNKEISEQMNIPIKSLERHITYMRKNGLL